MQPTSPRPCSSPEPPPASVVGGYLLLRTLGEGGLARVHEGVDLSGGGTVAVKVLRHGPRSASEDVRRLFEEARIMRRLQHPGVLPALDRGIGEDGSAYLVMPAVHGCTLRELLVLARELSGGDRRRWTYRRGLPVLLAAAEVLAHAHGRGVLHRDFKPSNVLFGDGEVFVIDWGLAHRTDRPAVPLRAEAPGPPRAVVGSRFSGSMTGTPGYISPEQINGPAEDLDGRTDVFSVGVVLYEVLTGHRAFPRDAAARTVGAGLDGPSLAPRAAAPELDIPEELSAICMRAMEPERERRFSSIESLLASLRAALRLESARESGGRVLAA